MRHVPTHRLKALSSLLKTRPAGQLIIQFSDACNATCPQCELRATEKFKRSTIPLDDVKRMIDHAAASGFQALSFTGGEPFLRFEELAEIIDYACRAGIPYVRTGSNGFFLRHSDKPEWERRVRRIIERLAETDIYTLWFSLDSAVPEVHEEMRGLEGVVRGMERALPMFHEAGIYPSANLGINRNVGGRWRGSIPTDWSDQADLDFYYMFSGAFHRFYQRVIDMGFTIANACYPMSVQTTSEGELSAVYGASSSDGVVRFTRPEKATLFRCLRDVIPHFRDRLRIFTPLSSLNALARTYADGTPSHFACPGGIDYFFVDARHGHAYPCGFRGGEDHGRFEDIDFSAPRRTPFCRKCDWECYRDPAEMLGPIQELRTAPRAAIARLRGDGEFARLWWSDVRYYGACGWFSGRRAPRFDKMRAFGDGLAPEPGPQPETERTPRVAAAREVKAL